MGLGGYPDVTLAGAREAARNARLLIKSGKDPIAEGRAVVTVANVIRLAGSGESGDAVAG
jgi:hypothetical protein